MIEVSGLRKMYRDGTVALNSVSFRLDKKITAIIGRNGAGKTTALRILSTQLLPSGGTARINGYDIIKDVSKIRETIVSIPQEAKPLSFVNTVDNVRLYLGARGIGFREARRRAERSIRAVGLWGVRDKEADELSGGMKRKIFVAMALAADSDIIFLDEPTTGLDPLSRIEVWSAIKEIRGQVILTTHYMEEAQTLSNEILMIDKGRILAQGQVEQLLRPFKDTVRVESSARKKSAYRVGNTWISYEKKSQAERFVKEGEVIKPITLDDLFIKRGVNLES